MSRRSAVLLGLIGLWLLALAAPALADNCGTPSDCFGQAGSFGTTAYGLLGLAAISLFLDFVPLVGTAKGLVEAVTGRDLLTGQELSPYERALGAVPFIGGVAAVAGVARAVNRVSDAADTATDVTRAVPRIGGRTPRNSGYAGRVYDGRAWTPEFSGRYPGGVRFTERGFPDFTPYARARVQIDDLTGVYTRDAAAANRAVGLPATPPGYTWHHVEDGRTMILIPRDLHHGVPHTGGAAVIRNGGFDLPPGA